MRAMATLSHRTEAQSSRRAEIERSVLHATEGLLDEGRSYAELSIEQIAQAAGIKRSGFYFYFRDKRELLMRLTEEVSDLLYAEADTWWSGDGDGPAELAEALERVVSHYREHEVLLRAVVEASAYDEVVAGFWRALMGRFVEATRARIESEQAAGRVPASLPAAETAFALTWMVERSCYQWLVAGEETGEPAFARSLTGIWTRAIYGSGD
jgi:AcrR family transcriptional regulator